MAPQLRDVTFSEVSVGTRECWPPLTHLFPAGAQVGTSQTHLPGDTEI